MKGVWYGEVPNRQLCWEQPREMALKMFLDLFVYSLAIEKKKNIKSKIDTDQIRVESKNQHPGVCKGAAGTLLKEKLHHIALGMFRPRGRDCLC